jgi:CRP-like cAMP-binding protein
MTPHVFTNAILNALDPAAIQRLNLRSINFKVEHEIEFPGHPILHIFFVETGMASITTTFLDGSQVEVGMFGAESLIGVSALMGTTQSLNRIYTQIPGHGFSSPTACARREFARGDLFQRLALAAVQMQLLTAMQSAGCNARHNFQQRLARWLLMCSDRVGSDHFHLTHEYLAEMLGCTRSTISIAAAHAQTDGLIEYTRGHLRILDRPRLEALSCECYQVLRGRRE